MHPFAPKKSLGQNFLTGSVVPRWLATAGNVGEGDTVLEIGPGTGALTRELLARGAHVTAIEADSRAITVLHETFAAEIESGALTLHEGDVREVNLSELGLRPSAYKLVANIPYHLSGILFRRFLAGECQPSLLAFLTQKEVAWRIAREKKESLLSLSVKAYGRPRYVRTVAAGNFSPRPKVDSAIIAVTDISRSHFHTPAEEQLFFELIHLGFGEKRKQLLGNLSARFSRDHLTVVFQSLDMPATIRAEDVPLWQWLSLCRAL